MAVLAEAPAIRVVPRGRQSAVVGLRRSHVRTLFGNVGTLSGRLRVTGVGPAYNIAMALFGGTGPDSPPGCRARVADRCSAGTSCSAR